MPLLEQEACPSCGRLAGPRDLCCNLCGHLLARRPEPRNEAERATSGPGVLSPASGTAPSPPVRPAGTYASGQSSAGFDPYVDALGGREIECAPLPLGLSPGAFYLSLGALLSTVFLLPFPRWVGWYFSALVHEMGHAAAGWALGCAAVPAIGVGEAVTVETAQSLLLTLGVWAAGLVAALTGATGRTRWVATGLLLTVYPVLAFSPFGTLAKLLAGHAAEWAFAGLAFWRALTGGFTSSPAERGLYSVLAWYLVADNLRLSIGLVVSEAARSHYAGNGSFGCVNDYIRVADGWFGGSLELVALLVSLPALAVLPTVLVLRHWAQARARRSS